MTRESINEVQRSTFSNLSSTTNGGVINLEANVKLSVVSCVFIGNKATGSDCRGGSIYISSTKEYLISKVCSYESSAHEGHFIYSTSSSSSCSPKVTISDTMTTLCSGDDRGVIMITYHNLLGRNYNSSFCTSGVHCNLHTYYSQYTNCKYLQFYKNKEDVNYTVKVASYDDVKENNYNLSVSTYVKKEDTREIIDIKVLNKQIEDIVKKENELRTEIDKIIKEIEG